MWFIKRFFSRNYKELKKPTLARAKVFNDKIVLVQKYAKLIGTNDADAEKIIKACRETEVKAFAKRLLNLDFKEEKNKQ